VTIPTIPLLAAFLANKSLKSYRTISRNLGFCFGTNCCGYWPDHVYVAGLKLGLRLENSILKMNFKIQYGNLCIGIKHAFIYVFFC
jgi:hypothetical protein